MTIYTFDAAAITTDPVITQASTPADLFNRMAFQVLSDYRRQQGSATLDEALAETLEAIQAGLPKGKPRMIREAAAALLANTGSAVPGGKFIPATAQNEAILACAASTNAAGIGALKLLATDGTQWPINTAARAATARDAVTARIAAVNAVRDAALTAYQADRVGFDLASIVWP